MWSAVSESRYQLRISQFLNKGNKLGREKKKKNQKHTREFRNLSRFLHPNHSRPRPKIKFIALPKKAWKYFGTKTSNFKNFHDPDCLRQSNKPRVSLTTRQNGYNQQEDKD